MFRASSCRDVEKICIMSHFCQFFWKILNMKQSKYFFTTDMLEAFIILGYGATRLGHWYLMFGGSFIVFSSRTIKSMKNGLKVWLSDNKMGYTAAKVEKWTIQKNSPVNLFCIITILHVIIGLIFPACFNHFRITTIGIHADYTKQSENSPSHWS